MSNEMTDLICPLCGKRVFISFTMGLPPIKIYNCTNDNCTYEYMETVPVEQRVAPMYSEIKK